MGVPRKPMGASLVCDRRGDDLLGDGVNVAARLEGIAEPGSIYISDAAHQQVRDKLDMTFEDRGEQRLKNIARPVRVYRMQPAGAAVSLQPTLPLPEKPSIAVLPFENMSGDPAQDYFSDGIAEDVITELSRFRSCSWSPATHHSRCAARGSTLSKSAAASVFDMWSKAVFSLLCADRPARRSTVRIRCVHRRTGARIERARRSSTAAPSRSRAVAGR